MGWEVETKFERMIAITFYNSRKKRSLHSVDGKNRKQTYHSHNFVKLYSKAGNPTYFSSFVTEWRNLEELILGFPSPCPLHIDLISLQTIKMVDLVGGMQKCIYPAIFSRKFHRLFATSVIPLKLLLMLSTVLLHQLLKFVRNGRYILIGCMQIRWLFSGAAGWFWWISFKVYGTDTKTAVRELEKLLHLELLSSNVWMLSDCFCPINYWTSMKTLHILSWNYGKEWEWNEDKRYFSVLSIPTPSIFSFVTSNSSTFDKSDFALHPIKISWPQFLALTPDSLFSSNTCSSLFWSCSCFAQQLRLID